MANVDYISDDSGDLIIKDGDFVKGDGTDQEVQRVLIMNQGMLTMDPILGPNLIRMKNSRYRPEEMRKSAKLHLERDGKDFRELEKRIKLKGNG